jgi:hypothetical protein
MSGLGLFIVGAFVTLIVAGAIALLIYGAILDGRHVRDEQERADARNAPRPPAVESPTG